MVDRYYGPPCCRGMAGLTDVRRGWVEKGFTGCGHTIVTTHAIVHDTGMHKCRGYPCQCAMTNITLARCWHMRGCFARCIQTIVTGGTSSGDLAVVDSLHRAPPDGRMAGVAKIT